MIVKALAALLLVCLIGLSVQTWRASHYKARAESLQGVANTLHEANVANQATIVALKRANETWAGKYAADVAKAAKEAQDAIAYAEQQRRAARDAQEALRHAYASHPTAKAWADVVVPESVSRILRQ